MKESAQDFLLSLDEAKEPVIPKVEKTKHGYQVMVWSRTVKKYIPQGQPHKTEAEANKDAKNFELSKEQLEQIKARDESIEIREDIRKLEKELVKVAKGVKIDIPNDSTINKGISITPVKMDASRKRLLKAIELLKGLK